MWAVQWQKAALLGNILDKWWVFPCNINHFSWTWILIVFLSLLNPNICFKKMTIDWFYFVYNERTVQPQQCSSDSTCIYFQTGKMSSCISGIFWVSHDSEPTTEELVSSISHSVARYFTDMLVYQAIRLHVSQRPTVQHREAHSGDGGWEEQGHCPGQLTKG